MKIDREQWSRLSALLDAALDIEPSEREGWLQQLPSDASTLKEPLRTLLAQRALIETGDFLKTPDFASALRLETARSQSPAMELQPGAAVGAYRLLHELGRGGMGAVWLAERIDGKLKRQVALKFPYAGPNQRQLAERLARERDILASLEHPNIARLYDADVTALGQPFLVLEYVDGISINEYCDQQRLTIRERLVLFLQVLNAVQYAHTHLVIHRDLKPSNILITVDRIARLLDFGIAKLVTDGAAVESPLTQFGGRALTPDYASPEQIVGQAITTTSDVYSLGVVLYELLAGNRPYRMKHERRASLEDAILEADIVAPSRAMPSVETAAKRSVSVRHLTHALRGDIDAIVCKALQKSVVERYPSVDALSQDIKRLLDGEVITAQQPSTWYRLRKLIRRNRLLFASTVAVFFALLVGAALALWQARLAQREVKKAAAVQGVLLNMFEANSDMQANPVAARDLTARQLLDLEAARVDENLKADPEVQEAVLSTLESMYFAVGLDDQAAAMGLRRIDALKKAYGPRDRRVAQAILICAGNIYNTSGYQRPLTMLKEVQAILDANGDNSSNTRAYLLTSTARFNRYLNPLVARQVADQAVALFKRHHPDDELFQSALLEAGRSRFQLGDYLGAKVMYLAALQEANKTQPPPLATVLTAVLELTDSELMLGEVAQAEARLREMLTTSRKLNGALHIDTLHTQIRLGALLHASSRRAEGRQLLATTVEQLRSGKVTDSESLASKAYHNWGLSLLAEGRLNEATEFVTANLVRKQRLYPESVQVAAALRELAELHMAKGNYAQAQLELDQALKLWTQTTAEGGDPATANLYIQAQARLALALADPQRALQVLKRITTAKNATARSFNVGDVMTQLITAQAYLQLGQDVDALAMAQQALDSVQSFSMRKYYQSLEAEALLIVGQAQSHSVDRKLAIQSLEYSLALRLANDDAASPSIAEAQIALANCLLDSGDRAQANRLFAKAMAIHAAHKELGEHYKKPLQALRVRLGRLSG